MFLQGNLQVVFDALYSIGAIDPVLKADWETVTKVMEDHPERVHEACRLINECSGDHDELVRKLHAMDPQAVQFIALEVAREFCEFQDRKSLH
ncbi:MAG: cytochrome [Bdellovibrionaceae bacterium]|nr:cytochrome [Pseudobdellovibrionaceae bacterium]MBX3034846.1 cytochrome [Pseudobdellovibrionaceae bacterium]